ncbi:MAG TPA: hypothetical protein VEU30_10785 [Thermoanaerobaculia bacterium]|nr:hypothetical protein [Thermoanaerobaculia bacterium]
MRLITIGLAAQFGGAVVARLVEHPSALGLGAAIVVMIGTAVYMTGFAFFARAKARSRWWCLLGLLSLFGLTLLVALPDYDFD